MVRHRWSTLVALVAAPLALGACGMIGGSSSSPAPRGATAYADLMNSSGQPAGRATLTSTGDGVFISAQLRNLPEGIHAMHIHETGSCDRPSFTSAGGHLNPEMHQHGFLNPQGQHAGDLPNITVRSDGTASADVFAPNVTLEGGDAALLGGDGTALMIHAGPDDYRSDPAGNAGPRIACGVIKR